MAELPASVRLTPPPLAMTAAQSMIRKSMPSDVIRGWVPVFPRDKREAFARRSCSNKKIERDDDSKKSHPALGRRGAENDSRSADKAELLQGSYPIVKADFLKDSTILEFQHGRAGEFHFATGVGRQRSDEEIAECRPRMGSAAFPSADDVIAFRNQIRGAPEVGIGERFAKGAHTRLDVFSATARFVKRILQQHVGCSEFIDNSEVAGLAPKIREPPANNSLVIFLLRHDHFSCCARSIAVRDVRSRRPGE